MPATRRNKLRSLVVTERQIIRCERCPELRGYCREIGRIKRRAYANAVYSTKPVPGFGDHRARILIVGLAPAAHGANRTGRMFTGDRSGDFLYAALHRAGLANQPESTGRNDGLILDGVYITAALRCAPPGNRPTGRQLVACRPYLVDEYQALQPRVVLCLGRIAWDATLAAIEQAGEMIPSPRPTFAHGGELRLPSSTVLGSYHVSQQNTFTGRLTDTMFDAILERAVCAARGRCSTRASDSDPPPRAARRFRAIL